MSTPSIRVFSYKRSGTHLMMATIWNNFKLGDVSRIMHDPQKKFYIGGMHKKIVPWANIFGGHNTINDERMSRTPPKNILYIVRNPINVFKSNYKFEPYKISFDKYCSKNRILMWDRHVRGFWNAANLIVRFEDLIDNPKNIIDKIDKLFDIDRNSDRYKIIRRKVGWYSSVGFKEEPIITTNIMKRFRKLLKSNPAGYM